MSILKRAVQDIENSRARSSGVKDADFDWDDDIGWSLITGSAGDVPESYEDLVNGGYRKSTPIAACINIKQNAVGDAKLRAFRTDDQGQPTEMLPVDHPAEFAFRPPNPRDSRVEFLDKALLYYDLGGNVFWRKKRNPRTGTIQNLIPIRPDRVVGADTDKDEIPRAFKVQNDASGNPETVPVRDLIHIPSVDPMNEVFGSPRLASAKLEIRNDVEASEYISEILTNHGQPGMVVGVQPETKQEQIRRGEKRWEDKFGPGRGRGKVAFVSGAKAIQQIGFNLSDLEFPNLRMITRESICSALGVDPIVAGFSSASRDSSLSGEEALEARRKLWKQTIIPMLSRWESGLNNFLAPEFDGRIKYKFVVSHIDALKQDRTDSAERISTMAEAGVFTLEELRSEMDDIDAEPADDATIVSGMRAIYRSVDEVQDPEPAGTPQQEGGANAAEATSGSGEDGDGDGVTNE